MKIIIVSFVLLVMMMVSSLHGFDACFEPNHILREMNKKNNAEPIKMTYPLMKAIPSSYDWRNVSKFRSSSVPSS